MCAAPGSKTAQIIEAVHANDKKNEIPSKSSSWCIPLHSYLANIGSAGLVVANDADYKRSHMLVHQCRRLGSPCFVATNHDASRFPKVHLKVIRKSLKDVRSRLRRLIVLCWTLYLSESLGWEWKGLWYAIRSSAMRCTVQWWWYIQKEPDYLENLGCRICPWFACVCIDDFCCG